MRLLKLLSAILAATMLCSFAVSCGESYKDAFIYIDFETIPDTLDPQLVNSDEELTVVRSIFDTLLRYDSKGKIVPSGAESFQKNGNTYTFKLKKDAKWTDGTSLTAHDYVFGFKRAVDPSTKSPYAASLFSIKGAEKINKSGADPSTLGVRAIDDYTLEIQLIREDTEFEKVLTTAITMPCNESFFVNCKGKYGLTLDTTPSCGSYYIRKWTSQEKFLIRLAKNLEFKGDFEANSMRIYFTCGEENPLTMLEHDNTDLAYISTDEYSAIKNGGFNVLTLEDTSYILVINKSVDNEIRQALLQSVNHNGFKSHLNETQRIAKTLYPKNVLSSDLVSVDNFIKYSPENAEKIYHQKVLQGEGIKNLSLKYYNDTISNNVAKSVAAHWQKTLSCFVNIQHFSPIEHYDMAILPFCAPTGTVTEFNSKLGYASFDADTVSRNLFENYLCYPLFFSTTNISYGSKIQNLSSCVGGGIVDVSLLIKDQ